MRHLDRLPRWFLLLVWATVVILLTTLPKPFPAIRTLAGLLGGNDVGDAIGHAFLFGSLTLLVYGTLCQRLHFAFAFWLAVVLVLTLSRRQNYRSNSPPSAPSRCLTCWRTGLASSPSLRS